MVSFNVNEDTSPDKDTRPKNNPSVRFYTKIKEQAELLALDPSRLDRNYKNSLQDCNMQFTLIYRDHLNGNAYSIKTLEVPSFIDGEVWDICFFCSPLVIEINNFIQKEPRAEEHFAYHQKLNVFFRNRKKQKFNQTLGNI